MFDEGRGMTEAAAIMEEHPKAQITEASVRQPAWVAGLACLFFFAITALLLNAYSLLHWKIIRDNYTSLEDPLKGDLFRLLGYLEVYHLTALLAVAFGIWTFRGQPRWMRWACLPFSILSLLMFIIVM
jgi:hypothetical protein